MFKVCTRKAGPSLVSVTLAAKNSFIMAAFLQNLQMEFIYLKEQAMHQLDYIYDARIRSLQQQKWRMRLVIQQVIDHQLHQIVESFITAQCSLETDPTPPITHQIDPLEVYSIPFTVLLFSLFPLTSSS